MRVPIVTALFRFVQASLFWSVRQRSRNFTRSSVLEPKSNRARSVPYDLDANPEQQQIFSYRHSRSILLLSRIPLLLVGGVATVLLALALLYSSRFFGF